MLKANSDSKVDRFLNNMLSFGFLPTITIPTRITEKTATLLDNIFINCAVADYFTRAIYDDISDHLPILLDIKFGYTKSKNNDISHTNRYIMNEKNYLKFENSLVNENWSFLDKYQINKFSPNEAYNIFLDKFKICYDRAFLLQNNKSCKNRRGKPLLPWMTENLIRSCRKKSRLLKIYKKTGAAVARNKYVKYKNTLKQALRHEEKYYYEQQFQAVASDARKTWKIINSLLNKQTNKKLSHIFQSNNITTTDKTVIVKMFNEFFVNLGPDLAKKIAPSKRNKLLEGIPHIKECMALSPTDANEVANMILSLKNTASCGSDQISVAAIKTISNIISPLLSALINHSMDKGIFPDALKIAKILAIYKSGDKTLISNYRPISLLTVFSKVYEKIIQRRLDGFLTKHKVLYDMQFGFRKNHSTQHALVTFTDYVTSALDKNQIALSIFIDLSKAFDTINHNILLKKLEYYGVRGLANDLIKSYLTNRQQYVEIENHPSDLMSITCGVPQGSILGPLLFLIYVNDMHTCSSILKFFLFADDTTILLSSDDINFLINTINTELLKLADWFALNKLSLNVSKTNFIVFNNQNIEASKFIIHLSGSNISRVNSTKFLGVEIDEKLSWKKHTESVERKLSSALFLIRKIRYKINCKTAQNLYDSLILPHISYCILIWGNGYKSVTSNILKLQKRALRLCYNKNSLKSDNLFPKNKLMLHNLYNLKVAEIVHRYFYTPSLLPVCVLALFEKIADIHGYQTRSLDNLCLFTNLSRLNIRKSSLKISAPAIWNKIPPSIRHLNSFCLFKKNIKSYLQLNL